MLQHFHEDYRKAYFNIFFFFNTFSILYIICNMMAKDRFRKPKINFHKIIFSYCFYLLWLFRKQKLTHKTIRSSLLYMIRRLGFFCLGDKLYKNNSLECHDRKGMILWQAWRITDYTYMQNWLKCYNIFMKIIGRHTLIFSSFLKTFSILYIIFNMMAKDRFRKP